MAMLVRRLLAITCMCGALGASSIASAQGDPAAAGARLEKIRVEVTAAETEINTIQREFNELVAQRNELAETLKKLKRDDQALESKLIEVEDQRQQLIERVDEAERNVERERERNGKRLRAMYIQTAVSSSPLMLGEVEQGNVERAAMYSRAVRESDQRRFNALRVAIEELIAARMKLEGAIQEAQGLRDEIKAMRLDAEKKQREIQRVVKEIQARKEKAQASLSLLRKEAAELEKFIASVTTGVEAEEEEGQREEKERRGEEAPEPDSVAVQPPGKAPVLDPRGLFGARASLAAPVRGEIVQHFGKVKLASFKDVLFSKGIEYAAKDNDSVFAVLGGTVAFAGDLPGYDTVVILDHGARSYSLYGRLGSSAVKKDDVVAKDAVLGTTSVADSKGRNFYFEVRKSGNPVDPETVLPRVSR